MKILGIFSVLGTGGQQGGQMKGGVQQSYVKVLGMRPEISGRYHRGFTPEEEEDFLKMAREKDIYDRIVKSIAPAVYGHEDIKRALACQLFGGSRIVLPDGVRLRGDINILLLGDPGTAKSQMLKFIEKLAPIGVYTSGKGSSAAGLTASVVKDKSSREFYLEGGAMVLADGGIGKDINLLLIIYYINSLY